MSEHDQTDGCTQDLIPTRASLLERLKDWEDDQSWRTFFDTYWRLIYSFALRQGLSHEEAQEVVQETVLAVAKNMRGFNYDPKVCRFKTWLLTITRSKMANQFRKRGRHPGSNAQVLADDSRPTPLLHRFPDVAAQDQLESAWEDEWQRNLMDAAIQRVKRRVAMEHFQMFDLFVLKGWPARDVARTLGVTVAHVYVAKHRISRLVQKETRALEANSALPK